MRKKIMMAVCGLVTLNVWAQDSLKTTHLQEIVISATRTEQSVIETPRSVTVINSDAIEKSVYNSVGELLSERNGMYVVGANQTPGSNQSLFMRGASSNQVVVMVDGIRITDPTSPNAAIDLSEVSLTNVDRIEIIRGSHSTIYGGAAIGGVINIITKKNQANGLHGNAAIQAGTFRKGSSAFTETVDLNYAMQNGFYVNGSVFQQNVNGLDATLKRENSTGFSTADEDDFSKTDAFIKTGFRKSSWDAFIAYKDVNQRADIDAGAFNDDDNNYLDFDRELFEYRAGYQFNDHWKATLLGSWSNSARRNENDSSIVNEAGDYDHIYFNSIYNGKLQTHELQFDYAYQKVKGILGAGSYYEKMGFDTYLLYNDPDFPFESRTNYDTINTAVSTNYIFGQVNFDISNLSVSLGSRFSHHELAGNYWTAEFSPSYRLKKNTLLYASLSTGFNAPSIYQLYDPSRSFGAFTSRGNKDLKAEESLSIETGVKKEFSTGSYITLSVYQTNVRNSIEYIYLWNGAKPVSELDFSDNRGDTYVNIASQQTRGIELDGHAVVSSRIFINANLSWMNGEISVNTDDVNSTQTGGNHVQLYNFGTFLTREYKNDQLTRRPSLTGFAQISYQPVDAVSATASYRYADARFDVGYDNTLGPYGALRQFEVGNYHLIDAGITWRVSRMFTTSIKVENLLNENYSEIAGFQTRGRSAYLKLSARW